MALDTSLAPGFLVAAPTMRDPRFAKTVILLAESNDEGALGFVINRETPFTFDDLEDQIGLGMEDGVRDRPVNYGGPVSPERGWVLFEGPAETGDDEEESVLSVTGGIRVAATLDVLGSLLSGERRNAFKLLLGYAGWAPQQLENEITEGSWIPMDIDQSLIWGLPAGKVWGRGAGAAWFAGQRILHGIGRRGLGPPTKPAPPMNARRRSGV